MNDWAEANADLAANDSIELKRIFYEPSPAGTRIYSGAGTGMLGLMNAFGWGNQTFAVNALMMPLNYDLQVMQAIELNRQIRRSNYSFELINNNLKIFPIPTSGGYLFFEYIKKSERNNPYSNGTDLITNVGEVPFSNPDYNKINSIGRQWIFEMTLAIAKEMLGYIRGKYSTIPIPNADVTLNQSDLLSSATADRAALIERLRAYFDETSRDKLLERRSLEGDYLEKELNKVPYTIFIG